MTAISDHCAVIRGWLNFEYSDDLITSWTRMAEEFVTEKLRCKHMVTVATVEVEDGQIELPSDWQELDFVRVVDGKPLNFRTREEYFTTDPNVENQNVGFYTITGNTLYTNAVDGAELEVSYYAAIPPLATDSNWLMQYYSRIYVCATLSVGAMYSFEDERGPLWQAAVDDFIASVNGNSKAAKTSGSTPKKPRSKGFG